MQDPKSTYSRYRIFYTKKDAARFIGHLDLQGLFSKALRRAKLPVAYSQGFNPHQLLSIAMPLSMGFSGTNELFEIFLTKQVNAEDIVQKLNEQMPSGIEIINAQETANTGKAAAGLLSGAIYKITFPNEVKSDIPEEVADGVFELKQESANTILATLAAGSKKNLKPQKLVQTIIAAQSLNVDETKIKYERIGIIL